MQIDSLLDESSIWRYMFYEANSTRLVEENASWAEICITYRATISRSSMALTAASIVLCIRNSEVW